MERILLRFGVTVAQRFFHTGAVAAVLALGVSCQPDSHSDTPRSKQDSTAEVPSKKPDVPPPEGLVVQFSDDFNKEHKPPDRFDMTRWVKWSGQARTENGYAAYSTGATPGQFGVAGISTRAKYFNPGLRGTNGVEVTLVGYLREEGAPAPTAEEARMLGIEHGIVPHAPLSHRHDLDDFKRLWTGCVTGMTLTISNVYGQVALPEEGVRSVQLHFDLHEMVRTGE